MRLTRWTVVLVGLTLGPACQCGGGQTTPVDGRLVVAPASLDFGRQTPGSETRLALQLTNSGTATLELSNAAVAGDERGAFWLRSTVTTLRAGETATLQVAYLAPATTGSDVGTLSLQTNARVTPEVLVSLVGRTEQPCVARTCAELGSACGQHLECGATVECGMCAEGACIAHVCEGRADGGADDAGTEDAGVEDAGSPDAGSPDAGSPDAGSPDAGSPDAGSPDAGMDAGFSVDPSRQYVFVTRSSWTGNLGGVAGADAKCAAAASTARLPGTYRAILITNGQVLDEHVPDGGPWYRVDGQLAFQDTPELLSAPRVPLSVDERGAAVSGYGLAWTGVIKYGRVSGSTCNDWTSSGAGGIGKAGDVTVTTSSWFDYNATGCPTFNCGPSCSTALHLYCLEQ